MSHALTCTLPRAGLLGNIPTGETRPLTGEDAASVCSDIPLARSRRPYVPLEELADAEDIRLILSRANEEQIPWDEVKRQLGL